MRGFPVTAPTWGTESAGPPDKRRYRDRAGRRRQCRPADRPRRRGSGFERQRFPWFSARVNHPQARLFLRQLLQHLRGVVRRSVVDGNNFYIFIPLIQRGADVLPGIPSLVETGIRMEMSGSPASVGAGVSLSQDQWRSLKPEIEAAGDPKHRHEQRPEEHKIQNQFAGKEGGHA